MPFQSWKVAVDPGLTISRDRCNSAMTVGQALAMQPLDSYGPGAWEQEYHSFSLALAAWIVEILYNIRVVHFKKRSLISTKIKQTWLMINKIFIIAVLTVLSLAAPVGGRWDMDSEFVQRLLHEETRTFDQLIQDLEKNGDPSVRKQAALVLGYLNDTRAVEPLIQALKVDDHWWIRTEAAYGLSRLNDTRAVEPFIQALSDEDENSSVRAAAADGLGYLKATGTVKLLIQALKDDDWTVRAGAASSLGKLNDTRAVEPLIQTLKDDVTNVRFDAAEALGELGDARAVDPLIQLMKNEEYAVIRTIAGEALEHINAKSF